MAPPKHSPIEKDSSKRLVRDLEKRVAELSQKLEELHKTNKIAGAGTAQDAGDVEMEARDEQGTNENTSDAPDDLSNCVDDEKVIEARVLKRCPWVFTGYGADEDDCQWTDPQAFDRDFMHTFGCFDRFECIDTISMLEKLQGRLLMRKINYNRWGFVVASVMCWDFSSIADWIHSSRPSWVRIVDRVLKDTDTVCFIDFSLSPHDFAMRLSDNYAPFRIVDFVTMLRRLPEEVLVKAFDYFYDWFMNDRDVEDMNESGYLYHSLVHPTSASKWLDVVHDVGVLSEAEVDKVGGDNWEPSRRNVLPQQKTQLPPSLSHASLVGAMALLEQLGVRVLGC